MKRIVEETLADGSKQYRVEKNTIFFGLIKTKWHTDSYTYWYGECDITLDAVFDTLDEAECYVYGKPKSKEIVSRKIL